MDELEERLFKAALLRVADALDKIEHAQNTLNEACALLSSVRGASRHWSRLAKISDRCKAEWYRLDEANRSKWRLDHDPA